MIEKQRSQKDKHGLGFTEAEASTNKTKTEKLGQVDDKTSIVEPAEPVPSAREPASLIVGNRPSVEVRLNVKLKPDEWIKESGCSRHVMGNKDLFSTYEAINGEPKNIKEAIKDESWTMAMQEELNQFVTNDIRSLVPPPDNQTVIDNKLFTKKRDSHIIIVQIYVNDIIFRSTCQDLGDAFSKIIHDEFEMSMMGELNFFLGLQNKQLEDGIFFTQSKYIKEMLKKFSLEDSKPIKTSMSSETKLTQDKDGESIDDTKYRYMIVRLKLLSCMLKKSKDGQKLASLWDLREDIFI
ncbi:retrovirus-related pol polyprotein from transposon TNT 1-94 [Tanacetum coccineum]